MVTLPLAVFESQPCQYLANMLGGESSILSGLTLRPWCLGQHAEFYYLHKNRDEDGKR